MPKRKQKNSQSEAQETGLENGQPSDSPSLQTEHKEDNDLNQKNNQNDFCVSAEQNKRKQQNNEEHNQQKRQQQREGSNEKFSHPTKQNENSETTQHNHVQNQSFLLNNSQHPKPDIFIQTTEKQNSQFILDSENIHKQLLDGLTLVGKVAQEILTHSPLKHESDVHGGSQKFTQNFDPAVYHYLEVTLQQSLKQIDGTNQQNQKQEQIQVQQKIKDSQQQLNSLNKSQEIIQVIKSCTSSDEQPIEPKYTIQLDPPKKDTINIIPQPQIPSKGLSSSQRLKIDQQKLNSQILEEREKEWAKIQEMEAKPRRPSFQLTHQKNTSIVIPNVNPNQTEKLPYTNNLPLIQKQKHTKQLNTSKSQSPSIYKKLLFSGLASGVCASALTFNKFQSKVAIGAAVGTFIVTYLIQK